MRPTKQFLAAALVAAMAALSTAAPVRTGDRVLLVSTRPVGCTTDPACLSSGAYAAEHAGCCWNRTALMDLVGSLDPAVPIVLYVHGNQETAAEARRRGLDVYQRLTCCAGDDRPIQFLIFSWESSKVPGLLRDYREKAARTKPVAGQLAWLMTQLPDGARVGLLGYSYGARVASGAAHLVGGGSLGSVRVDTPGCGPCRVNAMRAVFLAGAYDACWNARGRFHGRTLDTVESMLVTTNPRDPAMRFYKWLPRGNDPDAVGGVGPRGLDAERASRVCLRNVTREVGRSHDLYDYLAVPGLMHEAWRRLAFVDESVAVTPMLASAGQASR